MIILYVIVSLVSALFIVVILSGVRFFPYDIQLSDIDDTCRLFVHSGILSGMDLVSMTQDTTAMRQEGELEQQVSVMPSSIRSQSSNLVGGMQHKTSYRMY